MLLTKDGLTLIFLWKLPLPIAFVCIISLCFLCVALEESKLFAKPKCQKELQISFSNMFLFRTSRRNGNHKF